MNVQTIQPTPNPNAFKFLVDRPLLPGSSHDVPNVEAAKGNALAESLFASEGVETVFFCENFVTASMTGDADWRAVAEKVTRALESATLDAELDVLGDPLGSSETKAAAKPAAEPVLTGDADPEMMAKINALLDDRVRPALAGDGGGLEVLGMEGKTVLIRYQGACGSCPTSLQGTLFSIQNLLQAEVDSELLVTTG